MKTEFKISDFIRYPATSGMVLISLGVTAAWWLKLDISILFESAMIRRGEVWRLVTSIFPHVSIFHLIFNIYWIWILGLTIEKIFGSLKTLALYLLLAVASGSMEYALSAGGVGLSGVVYGLFGLLWVLSSRDERFHDVLNKQTINVFVGWFFLCIAATYSGMMTIGNVAHGTGAMFGVLIGFAIYLSRSRKLIVTGITALLLFGLWAATFGRHMVNMSNQSGYEEGELGYKELINHNDKEAIRWLREATLYQPKLAGNWFNLGIAYHRIGQMDEAKKAYKRAHELEPDNKEFTEASKEVQ